MKNVLKQFHVQILYLLKVPNAAEIAAATPLPIIMSCCIFGMNFNLLKKMK